MSKKKSFKSILLFFIAGFLLLYFFVPRLVTEIKNPLVTLIKKKKATPNFERHCPNGKHITFTSFDDTQHSAYITYADTPKAKGAIVLLHGIRSSKEYYITISKMLAKEGYHSIALDLRAHGQSGGTHCTFGVKEKKDIQALLNTLIYKEKIIEPIGIWGYSLGGAIALQSLGSDPRIQFGIIESTFSHFNRIVEDYFELASGFQCQIFTDFLTYRSGQIAEFDTSSANPIDFCANIHQPILMAHGQKDDRISIQYGKENFNALKSTHKKFIEVPNANHINLWKKGGDTYFEEVIVFLESTQPKTIEKVIKY